jgi:hypothetical protein
MKAMRIPMIVFLMLYLGSCSSAQFCKFALKKCEGYVDSVVTETIKIDTFYILRDTVIMIPLPDDSLMVAVKIDCDSLGRAQMRRVRDSSRYVISQLEVINGVLHNKVTLRDEEFDHEIQLRDMIIKELRERKVATKGYIEVEKKVRRKWDVIAGNILIGELGIILLFILYNIALNFLPKRKK